MTPADPAERRSALQLLSLIFMSLIGAAQGAPALLYLLDPVRRRKKDEPEAAAVPVARLSDVPDLDQGPQKTPLRVPVVARVLHDAWNRFDNVRQGSVWLYRRGAALSCFSTVCPHAGCSIDYDNQKNCFVCPCHGSVFSQDGARREGPTPRDMDRIDVQVKDGQVLCRYRRFRLAVGKKETI